MVVQVAYRLDVPQVNDLESHFFRQYVGNCISTILTIFGEFHTASWTDADFGYALQISGGNDEDSLLRMVESVIRNQQN